MNIRLFTICLLLCTLFVGTAVAHEEDIDRHRSCEYCGMDRKVYGYSRALVVYEDGSQTGVCSLHCAITELNTHKDRKLKQLLVADRDTHRLIDAKQAIWVMGGGKRGVMTMTPKWAFATKVAAQAFITANGGKICTFDEARKAAEAENNSPPARHMH